MIFNGIDYHGKTFSTLGKFIANDLMYSQLLMQFFVAYPISFFFRYFISMNIQFYESTQLQTLQKLIFKE